MTKRTKFYSIGLLAIIVTVLFVNGFLQLNFQMINNGSNSGSNDAYPTFGNTETQYTVYGDPTALTVQKSETITIDLYPNGTIKTQRVTVSFVFENEAEENCSFDLIDRIENSDLDSIRFQKGTFPAILDYEIIKSDENFGVNILKWLNITITAGSRAEYGYSMNNYMPAPIEIETEYWVNGSLIDIDPENYEINASIGSFISNIIHIRNIQQGLFSTSDVAKPTTICLVTLILPFEEDEEDRDLDEFIYDPQPILSNVIAPIQQVSWLALGDEYKINWSTTILKGGGWGIIELQPIRFDIIQSADLTGLLFDGLSGLLGILAAQQAYWAGLTLMAMIEELMGMLGIFQILLNDIQTQLGMLSMLSYSLINSLLISLIELDMTKTSLQTIYDELSNMYNDIEYEFGILDPVCIELRRILGIGVEGLGTNGAIGLGIPYMSLPLIIDYYEDVERRIVASFGAQLNEIMGSPALINFTSTVDNFRFFVNSTATQLPDNSTDFYVLIDITNLSLPIALGYSLNLSASYEFQLNVPLDRTIFEYIDEFFGAPSIPLELFPSVPGSPESNIPGFYTWILDMLRVGESAIWATIGNLTRSLSTMMLLLDSSFSQETLDLLDAVLTGSGAFDLTTPITLETGFTGLSDLTGMFSGMEEQFRSPFGSPFGDLIPDMDSFDAPVEGADMALIENFGFWTALKVYMEPVPRVRQLLNITIPLDFGNMTEGMDMGDMGGMTELLGMFGDIGFGKSAENGYMSAWNWTYAGLSTATLTQTNQLEGNTAFKRFQFQASGAVDTGTITMVRDFNYTIPVYQLMYRLRTDNANPVLSVVAVSQNATGHEVYAIQEHDLSNLSVGTWYDFHFDLRTISDWDFYDASFDLENIRKMELRITPHTGSTVNLDLDYLNLTHEVLPYPYDLSILDGYVIGDGVELFPNITSWDKWTSGLMFSTIQIADMNGDGINDTIAGSNDGYIYVLNGSNGVQLWNFSAGDSIVNVVLEDIGGDPTPEIIFATEYGLFYVINKTQDILGFSYLGTSVDYFLCGNLTGNGIHDLVIVHDNNVIVVDYTGNIIWNTTVKGTIRDIEIDDINGNGLDEIGVATSKYKIYVFNGTNGTMLWDYITEERPTHLEIGNFWGDTNKELLYSTDEDYCVVLDGIQGSHITNFTADGVIRGLYTVNLTNTAYNDILVHTGLIGQNLSAIAGNSFNLLWNFTSNYSFGVITSADFLPDNYDEVIITTILNNIYALDSSGNVKLNFTTPRTVNKIVLGELTQEGLEELIFGLSNNYILTVNVTDQQQLWMMENGEEIIDFQFIRTNDSIQLLYNLQDPFTEMLDMFGFSLTGTDDLANLASFDIDLTGMLGGMEGIDLSSFNISTENLPLKGLGLVNMLEMEITLIATLQDMKQISSTQRSLTGLHEVRYIDRDTVDYQFYPMITDGTDAKYVQYKIRNYEEETITVHYFLLNFTLNGQPLPEERISIEGWNGTHFIDLGDNSIFNITMAELGLDYINGTLFFKPYLEIEELEKTFITIDWMGRELRIKINTTGINPNDLYIEPWADVSIELPGIELPGITSTITYQKTHPTFIVSATPIPNITGEVITPNILIVLLTSPVFWLLLIVGFTAFMGFGYMQRREEKEVKTIASKKIIKWLKLREPSWQTLVKADVMSESQYHTLRRIRYRIKDESLTNTQIEKTYDRVMKWDLIGHFISTVLLVRFWRGVNKKSRLIWIMNTLENMVITPLKRAWNTFKTALGYLNPWDMDRQKKRELKRKAVQKSFWKKIEPPKKIIKKKTIEIISPSTTKPTMKIKAPGKPPPVKKPKDEWDGEYRADGGTLIKKISSAKKLPPFASRDGRIFYTLSQRKFVGMTLKELSKVLDLPEFEILVSLVRLFEKGLIFLLQESASLSYDLWDVATSQRKYDSELEKMIDSIETLETELEEGIIFLQDEMKKPKKPTRQAKSLLE